MWDWEGKIKARRWGTLVTCLFIYWYTTWSHWWRYYYKSTIITFCLIFIHYSTILKMKETTIIIPSFWGFFIIFFIVNFRTVKWRSCNWFLFEPIINNILLIILEKICGSGYWRKLHGVKPHNDEKGYHMKAYSKL